MENKMNKQVIKVSHPVIKGGIMKCNSVFLAIS